MTNEAQGEEATVDQSELQLFITSTLTAIMAGIRNAQGTARVGAAHNPGEYRFSGPKCVDFDIAVTAERSGARSGGVKIAIMSLGANASGERATHDSTVTRISFSVPTKFKRLAGRGGANRAPEAEEWSDEFEDE